MFLSLCSGHVLYVRDPLEPLPAQDEHKTKPNNPNPERDPHVADPSGEEINPRFPPLDCDKSQ